MKIRDESLTIVIAGNWNKYILTPEWVSKNLFDAAELKVEIPISMNLPPRFADKEIRFIPSNNSVILVPLILTDEVLNKVEAMAVKLIEKLPYTPIGAFGINFGFIEDNPEASLCALFNTSDQEPLSTFGCDIKSCIISRKLEFEGKTINLTITNDEASNISFDFNFHYEIANSEDAIKLLGTEFLTDKAHALNIMKTVYGSEICEEVSE